VFAHGAQRRPGGGEVGAFGGECVVAGLPGHAGREPVRGHGRVSGFSPDGRVGFRPLLSPRRVPRPRRGGRRAPRPPRARRPYGVVPVCASPEAVPSRRPGASAHRARWPFPPRRRVRPPEPSASGFTFPQVKAL